MIMGLSTRSRRLGGTISGKMKQWRVSGSTVGCATGLPAFGLRCVESARDGRRHHRTVCRLPRQSNSDKTHLATAFLIPSLESHGEKPGSSRSLGDKLSQREVGSDRKR